MMKGLRSFTVCTLVTVMSLAFFNSQAKGIKTNEEGKARLEFLSKSQLSLTMANQVGQIGLEGMGMPEGDFIKLNITGYANSYLTGSPNLPIKRQLIEIPHGAVPVVNIISYEVAEYDLDDYGAAGQIVPVQPPQPKCGDSPGFVCNTAQYSTSAFLASERVTVDILGKMREVRIARINIHPVEYNPAENKIRVYENLVFEINFENADLSLTESRKHQYYSPYFNNIFNTISNYTPSASRENLTTYPVKYLIISDPMFEAQLQPFIEWKRQKGFTVVEAYTDETGSTKEAIKAFIQNLYNAGTEEDPAPSFVLFVGDIAQIPSYNNGDGVTDRNYMEYTGDLFPEIFYGRFSAENAGHLQPYIDKTLQYEQYTMPDPSYLEEVVMIAGMDGSFGHNWANGQINYGTINYFNEDHGITSHTYLYPESGSNEANIIQDISNGVTFANYTAHCSPSGWADPTFVISDIQTLQNADKYGLLIGNCCSSSEYQTTCFAEEIVRAPNKGAVGYIGGSNSTYWDEDYYFGVGVGAITEIPPAYEETTLGNYDRSFHDHGEAFGEWYVTMDQIIFAGNLAVTESGSSLEQYYWDIYNLIGDPSLMVYYGMPGQMDVDHASVLMIGATSFEVQSEPYAYLALHIGNQTAVALADGNGDATLNFDPIASPGTAQLVITSQNFQPYTEDVLIIAPEGAFCIFQSLQINDDSLGNGNTYADFDESVFLNIALENYGNENAYGVNVTIETANSHVSIIDSTETYDTILMNEAVAIENGFLIQLADDVPDQMKLEFTLTAVDENDSVWTSDFSVTAYAPDISAEEITVLDEGGDGILDPGETAVVTIKTVNNGHCSIQNVLATFEAYNQYITVTSGPQVLDTLRYLGGVAYPEFDIAVADDAPEGIFGEMHFQVSAAGYELTKHYYPKIGRLLEDWETGNMDKYDWQMGGNADWALNMDNPFEGNFDLKSAAIGHEQSSEFSITYEVMTNDSIIFNKKVSSESGYDFLNFYIDNTKAGSWSGSNQPWSRQAYAVSPGVHTFRWAYEKDYSAVGGSDCAWVDFIILPTMMVTTVYAGHDEVVCAVEDEYLCQGSATNYDSIYWTTTGSGTFNNVNVLSPRYIWSQADIDSGELMLILNLVDQEGLPASDTMVLNILQTTSPPAMPEGPNQIDLEIIVESDYTTEAVDGATAYHWMLSPAEAGVISGDGLTGHVNWDLDYEGIAYVKVAAENECGMGGFSDSLYIVVSNPVGFTDLRDDISLSILPNPNNGLFNLHINSDNRNKITLSVLNFLGQEVLPEQEIYLDGNYTTRLDLTSAEKGIYFVVVQIGNSRMVEKLMLNK